jgi:uncharacterized protein (DUF302 family)
MFRRAARAILWMLGGMMIMGATIWFLMPSMMLVVHESPLDYQETIDALKASIENKAGWKAVETYDFRRNIHDAGHGPIEEVGAIALCHPLYASQILAADDNRKVTAFMPLGIGIYEDREGTVYISELNVALLGMMFGGTIADVMSDAGEDINEIILLTTTQ